jgi:triacylglycerol lipase
MLSSGGGFQLGSTQEYDGTKILLESVKLGSPILYIAINYRYV